MVKSYRKNVSYDFYRGRYLPSNGIIANVVLRDLDLNFQDNKLKKVISWKSNVAQKCMLWFF